MKLTLKQRVETLAAENAALRAQVSALETQLAAQRRPAMKPSGQPAKTFDTYAEAIAALKAAPPKSHLKGFTLITP